MYGRDSSNFSFYVDSNGPEFLPRAGGIHGKILVLKIGSWLQHDIMIGLYCYFRSLLVLQHDGSSRAGIVKSVDAKEKFWRHARRSAAS